MIEDLDNQPYKEFHFVHKVSKQCLKLNLVNNRIN